MSPPTLGLLYEGTVIDLQLKVVTEKAGSDDDYQGLINLLREGKTLEDVQHDNKLKAYKRIFEKLSLIEMPAGGLLAFKENRVFIPTDQRKDIVKNLHKYHWAMSGMLLTAK